MAITHPLVHKLFRHTINTLIMVLLVLTNMGLLAPTAQAALVPNVTTPWVQSTYNVSSSTARSPNFFCTGLTCPTISNPNNAIDANLSNYASITFPLLSVFASAELGVKQSGTTYPAGTFAGFRIEKIGGLLNLDLFNNMSITTYLGGSVRESKSGSDLVDATLLGLIGSGSVGAFNVGLWTTQSFDEVRIKLSQPIGIGLGGETRIYSALLEQAAIGPNSLACNSGTGTNWAKPNYPVRLQDSRTGVSGVCLGCKVEGASNLLDSNFSDYANIYIGAGLLGTGSVSVVDPLTPSHPAGAFAGFSIEDTGGLGLALLNAFTISTYLNGAQQEAVGAGTLIDWPLFVGRYVIGFETTKSFNEVRITAGSIAGLNTNVRVYQAVLAPNGCFNPNLPPIITSNGGGVSASISIPENTTAVTTVTAIDPDNDTLIYSINSGTDAGKFSINSSTGVLTFVTAPDFENPTDSDANNIYNLQVRASDSKGGIDTQDLSIAITNTDENRPPVITSNGGGATASISIPEKTTAVTIVTATDPDADTVTFSITGGADAAKLSIDTNTGVLRFITAPNYGSTLLGSLLGAPGDANGDNIYEVTVQASDGKGGTDTQAISITVTKVLINLRLQIKTFLQGAYDESTTLMGDGLRVKGLIPILQPYTNLVGSLGLETVSSSLLSTTGNNAPVDWVLIELRSPLNPNQILLSIPSILQRDGDVVDPVTGNLLSLNTVALGSYYLAIRHRNHLGIRTKNTVSLLDAINVIDFTKGILSQNEGILTSSGDIQLWAGDANADNQVIANGPNNDTSLVLSNVLLAPANTSLNSNYINAGYAKADLNLDGDVIFAGPNNDVNVIVFNVIMHPANSTRSQNYIVNGSL